jgi:hypothetical protein
MALGFGPAQNTTTTQLPFDSTMETFETQKKTTYRLPEQLYNVIRQEDWQTMEADQQRALITSMGINADLYEIRNVEAAADVPSQIYQPMPENRVIQQNPVARVESIVSPDQISADFSKVQQEILTVEKNFEQGTDDKSIENLRANIAEISKPVERVAPVLSQEDKNRIQEERGGAPSWLPKLFGYKPTQSTVSYAVSKTQEDDTDLDIKEAKSWLELLLRKLFYK